MVDLITCLLFCYDCELLVYCFGLCSDVFGYFDYGYCFVATGCCVSLWWIWLLVDAVRGSWLIIEWFAQVCDLRALMGVGY